MEKTFRDLYAAAATGRRNSAGGQPQGNRASGQCDFSIDSGQQPIDVSRDLDLPCVPVGEVPTQRLVWPTWCQLPYSPLDFRRLLKNSALFR